LRQDVDLAAELRVGRFAFVFLPRMAQTPTLPPAPKCSGSAQLSTATTQLWAGRVETIKRDRSNSLTKAHLCTFQIPSSANASSRVLGWVPSHGDPGSSCVNNDEVVHAQRDDGRAPDVCAPNDLDSVVAPAALMAWTQGSADASPGERPPEARSPFEASRRGTPASICRVCHGR
jgi:hypothetical protein